MHFPPLPRYRENYKKTPKRTARRHNWIRNAFGSGARLKIWSKISGGKQAGANKTENTWLKN